MNELKKDDRVLVPGIIMTRQVVDRTYYVKVGVEGRLWFSGWVDAKSCVPIDPDELHVGDRVQVDGRGPSREVEVVVYRVQSPGGAYCDFPRERLTKLPPATPHHVEYENDRLNLIRLASEATGAEYVCDHVDMGDPAKVEKVIVSWARNIGIDADDVRRRIAVPTVIDKRMLTKNVSCAAIRHATGWLCRVSCFANSFCKDDPTEGFPVDECSGQGMFPKIQGPYRKPDK